MNYTFRPLGPWTEGNTEKRRGAHVFKASWSDTLTLLARELDYLDATNVVIQVDVDESQIRLDGMVRAHARPTHPGVRVAFDSKHGPLTYATDAHERLYGHGLEGWQANVRAIALGLESLRAVDRYGVTRRGEQYTGWKALPAGTGAIATGMTSDQAALHVAKLSAELPGHFDADRDLARYRDFPGELASDLRKAKALHHPDRHGGDRDIWNLLDNAAQTLQRAGRLK